VPCLCTATRRPAGRSSCPASGRASSNGPDQG
jgi:hypothetical protein